MTAAICLLLPSLLVCIIQDKYEPCQRTISERIINYVAHTLLSNALMIFILYVVFNNYGQLISKLTRHYKFAGKYFALSVVIASLIAFLEHLIAKKPDIKRKGRAIIPYICLSLMFILLCVFLHRNVDFMLDSDMSSEMILAEILSKEKTLLSAEWFYSTELRVLNTQLVFTPLFLLFNNWHTIRIVGSVICWSFLLLSYYYLCRQLALNKYFAVSALCLVLPFSHIYFHFTIIGLYYIPHIAITFLTFGLIFQYIKRDKGYSKALLTMLCLLATGAGMGGPRQLLILYIPLTLTDIILYVLVKVARARPENQKIRKFFGASIAGSLFSVMGYLINTNILSKIYTYRLWENISYKDVSLDSFMKVINGILSFLGYQTKEFFSFATVSNLFCCFLLVLVVIIIYYGIKDHRSSDEYYICSIYYLVSVIVFSLLYTATNMRYSHRYNVPVLIFALPLIVLGLKEIKWPTSYTKNIGKILLVGMILCYGNNYRNYLGDRVYSLVNNGPEYRPITNFLLAKGYREGYASFWDGNILTELSNGKIDVRVWADSSSKDIDQIYKWLQLKSHVDTVPAGSVFVLLRTNQLKKIDFYASLGEENIIYKSDKHIIYGYKTYDHLKTTLQRNDKNQAETDSEVKEK